jgi:hypothetical protein
MPKRSFPLRFLVLFVALLIPWPGFSAEQDCPEPAAISIWTAPLRAKIGAPLKIMAVLTDGAAEDLVAIDPDGKTIPLDAVARGGPPWSLEAGFAPESDGAYRLAVRRGGAVVACRALSVGAGSNAREIPDDWNLAAEAFYSAWIEKLFDAPDEENPGFPSLEPLLRDDRRNFLHDYFGNKEDERLPATPDCADLPYFLRAYFAWKIGLPMAFRVCDRGAARPPHCGAPTIDDRFARAIQPVSVFNGLMRNIADAVHSGSARTALTAESADFYALPLARETLWPGAIYADPYGHTLMVAKWRPQTRERNGLLLAVDAQPDNSVSRKRFWEGTFLYAQVPNAGPGFKAFRPLRRDPNGRLRILSNAALEEETETPPYSEDQRGLAPEDFYARVERLIDPQGLAPEQAYEAMLDALVEQLQTRAVAVATGENYMRQHRGLVVSMPAGGAIFETVGDWEDYSTPSRDMRLLIAMNVLERLPERIVRYPESFVLGAKSPEEAKQAIENLHRRRIQERRFSYTRSDGSPWELSIADAFARRAAFETGYNPNDCAELRWGARAGTDEYVPCDRRAPAAQRARMEQYRAWFREARRPAR